MTRLHLALLLLSATSGCSGCDTQNVTHIRFAALNVANGFGDAYRTPAARTTQSALIHNITPDILALQEVDRGTERTNYIVTDFEITPPGSLLFVEERAMNPGEAGNSLWVREGARILDSWEIGHDRSAWVQNRLASDANVRRSICARVEFEDGRRLSACCAHLTASATFEDGSPAPSDAIRERQLAQIAGFDPDVILGDFNALDYELEPQMSRLGYSAATHGELVAIWWKLNGAGWMVPAHEASDHPGAAVSVTY